MIVGVLHYRWNYYPYTRTIMNKVSGVEYRKVYDVYSLLNQAAKKYNRLPGLPVLNTFDLNNQFADLGVNQVDLLHLYNGISYGKTPWVSHFETIVPRLMSLLEKQKNASADIQLSTAEIRALKALNGKDCKQLIAISECSRRFQLYLNNRLDYDCSKMNEKLTVMHPPQQKMINTYEDKAVNFDQKIRFMMVGAGFFRKGGREVLRVFEQAVRRDGYPIELIIISSLQMDRYAAHENEEDVLWVKEKIASNQDWITHRVRLSNEEVLQLMHTAHVGLLPTYADTYGFSVLEFQAHGVPVITTDIRALPEINNNTVGWLIKVPKNDLGEGLYETEHQRQQLRHAIESGLGDTLQEIFTSPDSLQKKGQSALARIDAEHHPDNYAQLLGDVYQHALA